MFDVGFWELLIIFVLGLIILGPERLPRVAAQIGRWVGKARRTAIHLRRQLERELELDELINPRSRSRPKPPMPPPGPQRQADGTFGEASSTESSDQPSTEEASPQRPPAEGEQTDEPPADGVDGEANQVPEAKREATGS